MLVEAPFSSRSKSEIIKIGSELSVPFELTWFCYFNGLKHCRKCMSCVNPRRAFSQASVGDTTEYEK
jgi:7-cyano-7-deazaguanine synthase